ncbi:restriction endonuclease [Labilibaculum sp.]|uniref:restriction endonuclease n=1 Tax=Labilibaculum sp. TaxID=2060723 RepID=UPI002AA850C4|nr:restriction endonuclease [Labilibaculum sp.]
MTDYYSKKIDDTINHIVETEEVLKNLNRPNYEDFLPLQDQAFYSQFKKRNVNAYDEDKFSIRDTPVLIIKDNPYYMFFIFFGILIIPVLIFNGNGISIVDLIGLIFASLFITSIVSVLFYPLTKELDKKFVRAKSWNRYYLLEKRNQNFGQAERDYDMNFKEYSNLLLELNKSLESYREELACAVKKKKEREEEKERQIALENKQREEEERKIRVKRLEQQYWSNLNGYEFEDAVCKLFKDNGFSISSTSYSNDGGADLIIVHEDGRKTIVQCKNFTNPVSPSVVRDLLGTVIDFKASNGMLVCTGGFTSGTVEFANRNGIELLDASDLIKMSRQINYH